MVRPLPPSPPVSLQRGAGAAPILTSSSTTTTTTAALSLTTPSPPLPVPPAIPAPPTVVPAVLLPLPRGQGSRLGVGRGRVATARAGGKERRGGVLGRKRRGSMETVLPATAPPAPTTHIHVALCVSLFSMAACIHLTTAGGGALVPRRAPFPTQGTLRVQGVGERRRKRRRATIATIKSGQALVGTAALGWRALSSTIHVPMRGAWPPRRRVIGRGTSVGCPSMHQNVRHQLSRGQPRQWWVASAWGGGSCGWVGCVCVSVVVLVGATRPCSLPFR